MGGIRDYRQLLRVSAKAVFLVMTYRHYCQMGRDTLCSVALIVLVVEMNLSVLHTYKCETMSVQRVFSRFMKDTVILRS